MVFWQTIHFNLYNTYSGTARNAGAILVVGRDLVIVPKLIHPLPPAIYSSEGSPQPMMKDPWMRVNLFLKIDLALIND